MSKKSLFISAGDRSGDNAVSKVVDLLKTKYPELELFGLGGEKLKALDQKQFAEPNELYVIGFWEVLKRYFFFRSLFNKTVDEIKKRKPSVILLVDYPGFNLRLAKKVKKLGIPIIYYISPQVWAWGKKRVVEIKEYVDQMIVILPFEEEFFRNAGVNVTYAGHYLLEDIEDKFISSDIPENSIIALLPGSRKQEIERLLPSMIDAAKILYEKRKIKSIVAGISNAYDYESMLTEESREFVSIVYDKTREVVYEAKVAIVASGTATLETGIIGRPMVIVYKTGFLTYQIAKRLVKLPMIGLVNLVLGEKIMPELIQNEASGNSISNEVFRYLEDEQYRLNVVKKLHKVPSVLGGKGASQRSAEIIEKYL